MKVYTKVVWQWIDGVLKQIEEEWFDYEGPVAQAAGNASLIQSHFRIRDDTTTPFDGGTPNWVTTEDQANTPTSVYSVEPEKTFRIRFTLSNAGTGGMNNIQLDLYYSKNGGTYYQVNTTSNSVFLDTNASTVDTSAGSGGSQLLSNGTGTWVDYVYYADSARIAWGDGDEPDDGEFCELEFGLSIINADTDPNDTFDFEIYSETAAITTYSKVPRITVAAVATPNEPTNVTAITLDHDSIYISWTEPSSGSPTGYKIERESPIGGGWSELVANTGTTTTNYTDNTCVQNTQYNYRIYGINESGPGTVSAAADATTTGFNPISSLMIGPTYF